MELLRLSRCHDKEVKPPRTEKMEFWGVREVRYISRHVAIHGYLSFIWDSPSMHTIKMSEPVPTRRSRRYVGRLVPRNPKTTNVLFFLVATFQAYQNGYDASMMNALNILPSYTDYFVLNTTTLSLNTASVWVGGIVAGFFAGQLCDWLGRKRTMFWSAILCIIGAIIQTAAQNIGMFVAARVVIGLACGIAGVGASTFLAESVAINWRSYVLGFFWDAVSPYGRHCLGLHYCCLLVACVAR